jgi:hypothetical protein
VGTSDNGTPSCVLGTQLITSPRSRRIRIIFTSVTSALSKKSPNKTKEECKRQLKDTREPSDQMLKYLALHVNITHHIGLLEVLVQNAKFLVEPGVCLLVNLIISSFIFIFIFIFITLNYKFPTVGKKNNR